MGGEEEEEEEEEENLYRPVEIIGREGEHAGDVGPPLPNNSIIIEIPAPRK